MAIEPITGQRRYANGGSVTSGDWRLLWVGFVLLLIAHLGHDYLGLRLPSVPVLEFLRDVSPIAFAWYGIRHARTRQP